MAEVDCTKLVSWSHRRLVIRRFPGFTWVQVALTRRWGWSPKGWWAVRDCAKARRLGPLWVCTMRTDAIDRAHRTNATPRTRPERGTHHGLEKDVD